MFDDGFVNEFTICFSHLFSLLLLDGPEHSSNTCDASDGSKDSLFRIETKKDPIYRYNHSTHWTLIGLRYCHFLNTLNTFRGFRMMYGSSLDRPL